MVDATRATCPVCGAGVPVDVAEPELTPRDLFAMFALVGLLGKPSVYGRAEVVAREAYEWADAMLETRAKGKA